MTKTHLPTPPDGYEYRTRRLEEGSGSAIYLTSGLFPVSATDARLSSLAYAPVLILDADLPKPRPEGPALEAALADLLSRLLAAVPAPPSAVVYSGGGYHLYWHLDQSDWSKISEAQARNKRLVTAVNASVPEVDLQVHDTGTRIMRAPGTYNRKGPTPLLCQVVRQNSAVYSLSAFGSTPTQDRPRSPLLVASAPPPSGFFAQLDPTQALAQLRQDPFVAWCESCPSEVKAKSWYGLATNIAATGHELGRQMFHELSALDPDRYSPQDTDRVYDQAMDRIYAEGGSPWSHTALSANGDWPGVPISSRSSPSDYGVKTVADDLPGEIALNKEGRPMPVYANLRKLLRTVQEKYRFNQMTQRVEFEGTPLTDAHYGQIMEDMFDTFGVSFRREDVIYAVSDTAQVNSYHPVAEYLNALPKFSGPSTLPALCKALGVEDSHLHRRYLECFLIGAVRRALCVDEYGIKHDTLLVLQGPQGIGKSSFFRLLGDKWFSDTPIVPGSKDAYDSCSHHWLIEWPEIDRIRDQATTKAFITSQVDSWRKVYARNEESHPRRCVFVGTTNELEFLHDESGSRRYHILQVYRKIDHALVETDRVWAEAVALAASGVPHWLSTEDDISRAGSNTVAQVEERWESVVEAWLERVKPAAVTIPEVLLNAVQIPVERWEHSALQEVGRILHRIGYVRRREQCDGKRRYVYRLPEGIALVESA